MAEGKTPKVDDLLSLAYATIFDLASMARKEEHWKISKAEAAKLGKVTVSCVNTIPEAAKSKVIKKFDKYLPWISLVAFGAVITYPRIALSMEAEKEKKTHRFPPPIPFPNPPQGVVINGSERLSPEAATGGDFQPVKTSFPPGHGSDFPPLDYKLPS